MNLFFSGGSRKSRSPRSHWTRRPEGQVFLWWLQCHYVVLVLSKCKGKSERKELMRWSVPRALWEIQVKRVFPRMSTLLTQVFILTFSSGSTNSESAVSWLPSLSQGILESLEPLEWGAFLEILAQWECLVSPENPAGPYLVSSFVVWLMCSCCSCLNCLVMLLGG